MQRSNDVVEQAQKSDEEKADKTVQVCPICGKPATRSVDGESSCPAHIEQVYEHQVEDDTSRHLRDNEWRRVWFAAEPRWAILEADLLGRPPGSSRAYPPIRNLSSRLYNRLASRP